MATLDRWRTFLTTPKTVAFPRLELIGRDHAPSIVAGTGEVRLASPSEFSFTLTGTPTNIRYAFAEIRRQRENPYDGFAQFRLVGTDVEGVEWVGGYTIPRIDTGDTNWIFGGEINSITTDDGSDTVSRQPSTELTFLIPPSHPIALAMARFARTGKPECSRREHVVQTHGSTIVFAYEPSAGALSITASHSTELPATYTENWLGEPLRIMFGQLVYPRLVARNFGNGHAMVSVRPSPGFIRGAGWAALWKDVDLSRDKTTFWSHYEQLLTLIARDRDRDGHPNFEPHKVTRLYEEIIQASRGSRWVWALTFASSIEGLVRMLIPKPAKPTKEETDRISSFVNYINEWPDDARLKRIATNAVCRTAEASTIRTLRELKAAGVIIEEQLSAWETIRNAVMHGSLVPPYSTEEEDVKLLALAATMHALTSEMLRRATAAPG